MSGANPLRELHALGQSAWLDYIRRDFVTSGALHRLMEEDDLRGLTSNPTIFEQAIAQSSLYDEPLKALSTRGLRVEECCETLIVQDIQLAADVLRPVYEATRGQDGFVSIEVSPRLARDTRGSLDAARSLWRRVARSNLMVKIPGTTEGLPAIEQLIAEGVNVNVTLLFAIERYVQVAEAYLRGLERRVETKASLKEVASVASFFVSRVDTNVDQLLASRLQGSGEAAARKELEGLFGQAAIANAKLAYEQFRAIASSPRFARLAAQGARVQRLLWGSTSTKNPRYRDVRYVEELIGTETINTMPPATLEAFRDHGRARSTLDEGLDEAHALVRRLGEIGVDLARVTQELEQEGIRKFADSLTVLLESVEAKRSAVAAGSSFATASERPRRSSKSESGSSGRS